MNPRFSDNEDVVMEILLRLPVKSLFRFKTVQKSWNTIISMPIFAKLYVESGRELNLNSDFLHKSPIDSGEICCPKISGPVKDLICIYNVYATQRIAIFDLSAVKMEIIEFPIHTWYILCSIGFGFNDRDNELVVVQLLSCTGGIGSRGYIDIRVVLYFGNKKLWSKCKHDLDNLTIKKAIGTCKNGSFCFWLVEMQPYTSARFTCVLSFDFNERRFRKTRLPLFFYDGAFDRKKEKIKIFVEDNALVLFSYPILGGKLLGRWVLNVSGMKGEWTKLPPIGPFLQLSKPVATWENHGIFLKCIDREGKKNFVFYDYATREITNIEITRKKHDRVKVIEYKGKLVSIRT
ncbi:hypothetical protein ACP275_07G103600 [Erythranthe tilingii]